MFTQICFCLPVHFRIIIYAFRQGVSDQKVPNTIHRGLIGPCKYVIVTMSRDQSVTFRDSSVFRYLLLSMHSVNSVTWQNYESIRLVSLVKISVSPGCTNIE